jgi:hypothetical protein
MMRANLLDYKTAVGQKINTQMKAISPNATKMTEASDSYIGWMNDKAFNALVAAYEMFFVRFPNRKML